MVMVGETVTIGPYASGTKTLPPVGWVPSGRMKFARFIDPEVPKTWVLRKTMDCWAATARTPPHQTSMRLMIPLAGSDREAVEVYWYSRSAMVPFGMAVELLTVIV